MFPYGGYDPFTTPSAKAFSQSQTHAGRPPYAQMQPTQVSPSYSQPYMAQIPPMMPQGFPPYPMMHGMPMMHQQGKQTFNQSQGTGFNLGTAMGGANQLMGIAQQVGNIISLFK
jgi:hypothetical protein